MCGILALIGADRPDGERSLGALDLIRHRGPDDYGVWESEDAWLGTRRLAIIDLSEGGHQPMVDEATGVVVTYNGEIYNYLEVREELVALGHRFRSDSDTEVLLRSYLQWGTDCVTRFNGMWAFLIWDPQRNCAFFARDRFGVKPFYYAMVNGSLAVASEPKQLLHLFPQLRSVNEQVLARFLAQGLAYDGDQSFYQGIRMLEQAHSGTFRPGWNEPKRARYWDFPKHVDADDDLGRALSAFAPMFEDAVRLRMRSDVPVGVTLSGGLDSTAVLHASASTLGQVDRPLRAFTSVYQHPPGTPSIDERIWAERATQPYPHVLLAPVEAASGEWLPTLRRVVWHMDGPGSSPAVFPLWKIMHGAREHRVPVLLEGQGADEVLGGYTHYAVTAARASLALAAKRPTAAHTAQVARQFRAGMRLTTTRMFALMYVRSLVPSLATTYRRRAGALGVLRRDFAELGNQVTVTDPARNHDALNHQLMLDVSRNVLPPLLQYGDAVSMANSVESRLPFLDYRLIELLFRMPGDLKVGGGETKRLLRAYLRSVGQHRIAGRVDKKGYPTPIASWLAADNGEMLRDILLSQQSRIGTYCQPHQVERLIDLHCKGSSGTALHLYRLLTTELWLQECF